MADENVKPFIQKKSNPLMNWIETKPLETTYYFSFAIGIIARILAALAATGILHPDEIFQSYEMAHLLVYGKGRIPNEFQQSNPTIESYAKARSWIFPLIFAMIFNIGEFFGLDYHTEILVLTRWFLAFNAILLIPISRKFAEELSNNKSVGYIAGIFIAVWFKIIEFTVRAFYNTFFLPLLFYGLYRALCIIKKDTFTLTDALAIMFGLGLVTYVRTDLGIIVLSIAIFTFNKNNLAAYGKIMISGFIGWIISASIDYKYYDEWFVVPINWFTFNIVESHADLFGRQPSHYYVSIFIVFDHLFLFSLLAAITLLAAWWIIIGDIDSFRKMIPNNLLNTQVSLGFATILTWTVYSNPWDELGTHKEQRFIIGGLILLLVFLANTTVTFAELIKAVMIKRNISSSKNYIPEEKMRKLSIKYTEWRDYFITFVVIFLMLSSYNTSGTNYHMESFSDVNEGLTYIGNQENVTGVVVISVWFLAGSYTYLHLDVDIRYVTIREENDRSLNLFLLNSILRNESYNYLLMPQYEAASYPDIYSILYIFGFDIIKVIDGTTEIWTR